MKIYIDITEYKKTRLNTGIQRVIKELISRFIFNNTEIYIISYDIKTASYKYIPNLEVTEFLQDVKDYKFKKQETINIFKNHKNHKNHIFLEIDSVWNTFRKREKLYPELKKYNFKIINLIYDLTPLLLCEYAKEDTKENFPSFIKSVFKHSDRVIFTSSSAQNDFFKMQKRLNFTKVIDSDIVTLGSDFLYKQEGKNLKYKHILDKKYILFVGTIEARKCHSVVLQAYEEIQKKHPNIHLLFIGKVGWKVEKLVNYINNHKLKDKNIHHLIDVDDEMLIEFYKKAYLVTYISNYEGFGLPIAESLRYSNITITSKNSSMSEVGENFVDYLLNNEKGELVKLINLYLDDESKYLRRKEYISKHYIPQAWDSFYLEFINSLDKI